MGDGSKQTHNKLRVLFFGMSGLLSRIPLAKLLDAGVQICGIILPSSVLPPYLQPQNGRFQTTIPQAHNIPLSPYPDILQLAAQYQIPVTAVTNLRHPDSLNFIAQQQPDLICVSCFNQKFPPDLLKIPTHGCINLHPSLLPQLRGPSPIFWTFQQGIQQTGMSLHFMDDKLDSGDIIFQEVVTLPDGISGNEAEILLAAAGGDLMVTAVSQATNLPRTPQTGVPSYFPMPTNEDFRLDLHWTAQHAFNFMCGTAEWQRPYFVEVDGERIWLKTAVACNENTKQANLIQQQSNQVTIQFKRGTVTAVAP